MLPLWTLQSRLAFFQKEDLLEWLVQTLPVGSPFQDVVLTARLHINPETSLERLVPPSRVFDCVKTSAKYILLRPADYSSVD